MNVTPGLRNTFTIMNQINMFKLKIQTLLQVQSVHVHVLFYFRNYLDLNLIKTKFSFSLSLNYTLLSNHQSVILEQTKRKSISYVFIWYGPIQLSKAHPRKS